VGRGDQIQSGEVTTFMAWARRLIREHGGAVPEDNGDFEDDRAAVIEAACDVVERENLGRLFDVIFVDEFRTFVQASWV
jgi:hypothetical protein